MRLCQTSLSEADEWRGRFSAFCNMLCAAFFNGRYFYGNRLWIAEPALLGHSRMMQGVWDHLKFSDLLLQRQCIVGQSTVYNRFFVYLTDSSFFVDDASCVQSECGVLHCGFSVVSPFVRIRIHVYYFRYNNCVGLPRCICSHNRALYISV